VITLDDMFVCCEVVWTFVPINSPKVAYWALAIQIVTPFAHFYLVKKAVMSVLGLVLSCFLKYKSLALAKVITGSLSMPLQKMVNFLFSVQYCKCCCANVVL